MWDVREAYKSLLIDFDELTNEEIREKRDDISMAVGRINKKYPGTDAKSFAMAQKNMPNYIFLDLDKILKSFDFVLDFRKSWIRYR